jgi:hypothetical protein
MIMPKAQARADKILCCLNLPGDAPALVPTSAGGLQLEWHRAGLDVEISIELNGEADIWIKGGDVASIARHALQRTGPAPFADGD